MLYRAAGYTLQLAGALGLGAVGTGLANSAKLNDFNIEKVKWDRVALITTAPLLALKSGRSIISKAKFHNLNPAVVRHTPPHKMGTRQRQNQYNPLQGLVVSMSKKENPQFSAVALKTKNVQPSLPIEPESKLKPDQNDTSEQINWLPDSLRDYEKQVKTDQSAEGSKADKLSELDTLDTSLENNTVTDVSGENPFIEAAEEMDATDTLYTTRQQRNSRFKKMIKL